MSYIHKGNRYGCRGDKVITTDKICSICNIRPRIVSKTTGNISAYCRECNNEKSKRAYSKNNIKN